MVQLASKDVDGYDSISDGISVSPTKVFDILGQNKFALRQVLDLRPKRLYATPRRLVCARGAKFYFQHFSIRKRQY